MRRTRLLVVITAIFLWPLTTWAVITSDGATIQLQDEASQGVPGATISIDGTAVGNANEDGQFRLCASEDDEAEDEDGVPCIYLTPGKYTIQVGEETMDLDWDGKSAILTSAGVAMGTQSASGGWQIGAGAGIGSMSTDVLMPRFVGPGQEFASENGASFTSDVDDSATSFDIKLLFRKPTGSGYILLIPRYFQADDLKGTASAGLPDGSTIDASGEFEIKGFGVDLGYEHLFSPAWSIFGGINVTRYDLEERSTSRFLQGGVVVDQASLTESEDATELGVFVGFGYLFRNHVQLRGRVGYTDSVFDDEGITTAHLNIVYWFKR